MLIGKTLFARSWTSWDYFHADRRPVWRRSPGPDASCAEQYAEQAFAQLTYREMRDIETCLSVHASKLYHMGFRQAVPLDVADANERRDWRMRRWPSGSSPARTPSTKNWGWT